MRLFCAITVLLTAACLPTTISQRQALFVKKDIIENVRQGTLREYLPPINTQKPRPFQPVTQGNLPTILIGGGGGGGDSNIINGYPPAGLTPQPPFGDGTIYPSIYPEINPSVQIPGFNGYPASSKPQPPFPPTTGGYPGTSPAGSTGFPSTGYPSSTGPTRYPSTGYPGPSGPSTAYPVSTGYPTPTTGYPTTAFPSPSTGYPTPSTGYPIPSTGYPTASTGYPTVSTGYPTPSTGYPTTKYPSSTGYPTTSPGPSPGYPGSNTGYPTSSPRPFPTGIPTDEPSTSYPTHSTTHIPSTTETESPYTSQAHTTFEPDTTPSDEDNFIPTDGPYTPTPTDHKTSDTEITTILIPSDDDFRHPPHIHEIDVECSKEMMTINIEFNRVFDGIIYSKGHYNNPECRYVKEHSGETKYTITVNLNSCGTEFTNAFDTEGKSYLENVLVLQNEPGIQEVWDTIRSVRCLWEGNLKKALNVALSVGMLNQEIVTFSGDTAMARLDIQLGKGPFAPPANGMVKIGEIMTLVVSVTGDPGFDIQVKDCRAKDSNGGNVVALTDERGCILKPKLFGAFQKTRNTGNTGASIIAYAFFNAFKFPDVMDLILECNVDLCKTDCEICPEPNQKIEPGRRRRRDLYFQNATNDNSVTMGKMLRVILPEDLSEGQTTINFTQNEGICMSTQGFILSSALLISLLTSSCLFSAYMWLKYQRINFKK